MASLAYASHACNKILFQVRFLLLKTAEAPLLNYSPMMAQAFG